MDDFINTLNVSQTVLVTGPTGCGKSTNIPSWIANKFPTTKTLLVQPRRLPVIKLAERICEVNNWRQNIEIGYIMGRRYFEAPSNRVVVATNGTAISALLAKPDYFDFIILDEIHERSSEVDQLLAICNELQLQYKFKLILMSATVNETILQNFSNCGHFEMAPQPRASEFVVQEFEQRDFCEGDNTIVLKKLGFESFQNLINAAQDVPKSLISDIIFNMALQIVQVLKKQFGEARGDILAFVPGIAQFKTLIDEINKIDNSLDFRTVYIHSRFSDEQKAYLQNLGDGKQTLIISTNICETSLTIPTLSYVVDSCLTKKAYLVNGEKKLFTRPASYQAIIQRAGRVGRCAPGIYIHCLEQKCLDVLENEYPIDFETDFKDFMMKFSVNSSGSNISFNPVDVLSKLTNKLSKEELNEQYLDLFRKQLLVKDLKTDQVKLSSIGLFASVQKFCYYDLFLGIPYTGLFIAASNEGQDMEIFIHEFEITANQTFYKSINAIENQMTSNLLGFLHSNSTETGKINYRMLPKEVVEWRNYKKQLTKLRGGSQYSVILGKMDLQVSGYSEDYAKLKILSAWRQHFPIPTSDPTNEERFWCSQRLLSPQGLRELELNFLSKVQQVKALQKISQIEENIMGQIFHTTKMDIENYHNSLNYDFKVNMNKHDLIWKQTQDHFKVNYVPTILRAVQEAEILGEASVIQLLTLSQSVKNKYCCIKYDFENQTFDIKPQNIYFKNSGRNLYTGAIEYYKLQNQLAVCRKPRQQQQLQNDVKDAFGNLIQTKFQWLDKYRISITPTLDASGKIIRLKVNVGNSYFDTQQTHLMLAAAFNYGPSNFNFKEVNLSGLTEFSYKYIQKEALKIHPLLPLSINSDMVDVDIINNEDEDESVPIDKSEIQDQQEKSQHHEQLQQSGSSWNRYKYTEVFDQLTPTSIEKMGLEYSQFKPDQKSSAINMVFPEEFSLFTCNFLFGRIAKGMCIAEGGIGIYILSLLLQPLGQIRINSIFIGIYVENQCKLLLQRDFVVNLVLQQIGSLKKAFISSQHCLAANEPIIDENLLDLNQNFEELLIKKQVPENQHFCTLALEFFKFLRFPSKEILQAAIGIWVEDPAMVDWSQNVQFVQVFIGKI